MMRPSFLTRALARRDATAHWGALLTGGPSGQRPSDSRTRALEPWSAVLAGHGQSFRLHMVGALGGERPASRIVEALVDPVATVPVDVDLQPSERTGVPRQPEGLSIRPLPSGAFEARDWPTIPRPSAHLRSIPTYG